MYESDIINAIAYCKDEIMYLKNAPKLNGCKMTPEWKAQLKCMETCLAALKAYLHTYPQNATCENK